MVEQIIDAHPYLKPEDIYAAAEYAADKVDSIEDNLIPRITKYCLPLYRDGYFKDAAREAMTQVEMALKKG